MEEYVDRVIQAYYQKGIKKRDIFCGWIYSENEFKKMWEGQYREEKCIYLQNTAVFFLTRME